MGLAHLAMNPNLTEKEFAKLAELHLEGQKAIYAAFERQCAKCKTPEELSTFLNAVSPLIFSML